MRRCCSPVGFWLAALILIVGVPIGWAGEPVDYERDIKPMLQERCWACHSALEQESGLRLDAASLILEGGYSGPAIVPGDASASLLMQRVTADDESRMPPDGTGTPLGPEELALLKAWIDGGAPAPQDEPIPPDPERHWSFQPVVRPPILEGESSHPIDAFLDQRHREHGLSPRPPVDRSLLLRRVYLDLIGLPPTRDELHDFLADESPDAYEKVVDRLLAAPQYGERWGRHWMDVWRYSDWYGRRMVPDVWNSAPQVWRWRDWIVQSLNDDKGYDRMLQEMLAADEIAPDDAEAVVATGYLVRNWYALNPNEWMRHTLEHTAKAMLGLTFNCAHCHDHKYDPIRQDDYFRLRAYFEPMGVRQDRVPGEADPGKFQPYDYSTLRKVVRLGAVRIFDENPDAPTWFYTAGDERNRVSERGSIEPGLPAVFDAQPMIETVELPPRAWYPGLRPAIQETVLGDARRALEQHQEALAAARRSADETLPPLTARLHEAEAAFEAAVAAAREAGRPGALAGTQSLLLDATSGRSTVFHRLETLDAFDDGAVVRLQLMILRDAHVNFQFTRDVDQGLTAAMIAFDSGRILSYQPGGFTEFEVGRYDLAAGQQQFEIAFDCNLAEDRCSLTVTNIADGNVLVDGIPVALNGWNPLGDPVKGILFDARPGSVAVVDEITLALPMQATAAGPLTFAELARFDFEPPTHEEGADLIGVDGWDVSSLAQPPGTAEISATAIAPELTEAAADLRAARAAVASQELSVSAAEARRRASELTIASVEARIAADRAKYGEAANADPAELARRASLAQRQAAVASAEATVLEKQQRLSAAEAKLPEATDQVQQGVQAATTELADARAALEAARQKLADASAAEEYTPLSPIYPTTSTGRRKALAEWIASAKNPLAARVAVNHIWLRHFHAPLVETVYDFGRNGAVPSHPELLDWLAAEFVESGWSMKHLHRLIVTSQAYRRSSSPGDDEQNLARDPENRLLWRMNQGRMEAEVVRDSLLYCAGRLDLQMGGQELENSEALTTYRRSLYYSCHPEADGKSEFGMLFDAPDATECYRRTRSIVPQQALALTNSELIHEVSAELAEQLWEELDDEKRAEPSALVTAAFEQILSRRPSEAELQLCVDFVAQRTKALEAEFHSQQPEPSQPGSAEAAARAGLIRAIFNHNDFIAIR